MWPWEGNSFLMIRIIYFRQIHFMTLVSKVSQNLLTHMTSSLEVQGAQNSAKSIELSNVIHRKT